MISIENKLNDMEVNDCVNQTIDNNFNLEVNDSQQMECELNNNKGIVVSVPKPIVTEVPIVEPVLSQKSDASIQTSPQKINNHQKSGPINGLGTNFRQSKSRH
jgi:hypothetical protein